MRKLILVWLAVGMSALASATEYYWIGDVSSDFEEPGNWRVGSATGAVSTKAPANNDYADKAVFTDAAVNKVVVCKTQTQINAVKFVDATGYELTTTGRLTLKSMSASGTGMIASIKTPFEIGGIPISVAGGTLYLDFDAFYFTGAGQIALSGGNGGVLRVRGPVGGWSKKRTFKITDANTLRLDGNPAFSLACKHVSLAAAGAKFVYRDTVAGAEAKFGKSAEGANGIVNEYDPENSVLVARALDGEMEGYVEVSLMSPGAVALSRDGDGKFVVTARNDFADSTMSVVCSDGVNEDIVVPLGEGETPSGTEVSAALDDALEADTTYALKLQSMQSSGTAERNLGIIYTGVPTMEKIADANEETMTPGLIRFSRAVASAHPLVVKYDFSSEDAVPGKDFVAPSGTVTIPAGEASADISVKPLSNGAVKEDQTIVFALNPGNYKVQAGETVEMTIVNSQTEMPENIWIAGETSDNLASTASNWSKGVPTADSMVLVSGDFSTNDIIWDASAPVSVASFVQTNYSGTVTFRTVYGESGFASFSVTGNCAVASGTWTHPANGATAEYRLAVSVGGDFSLGASAKINLEKKGYAAGNFPSGGAKGIHGGGRGGDACVVGDLYEPTEIGAGGDSYAGGGALRLEVGGAATVNGAISVISAANDGSWTACKAGAAGSVYIKAASVAGTGTINASAPHYNAADSATPSGGRVAIVLTEADELALPIANVTAYGTLARGKDSSGAGTILVKTASQNYGTLYVKNRTRGEGGTYGIMLPYLNGVTLIPAGETWTLDGIVFSGAGILGVREGTTLKLANGFASISGNSFRAGLLMRGGTVDAGDESPHVLQGGNWVFHAETPYAFDRAVLVRDGAAIGALRFFSECSDFRSSTVTVSGDLEIAQGGYVYASGAGLNHFASISRDHFAGYYAHGGTPSIYGTNAAKAYGSALNPVMPGVCGYWDDTASQCTGGGVVKLTVTGRLTVDGTVVCKGAVENAYSPGGTGGSVNITAGVVDGAGTVVADGSSCEKDSSKIDTVAKLEAKSARACAGGGRVSIRLTEPGATFPDGFANRVRAYGGIFSAGGANITGTGTNGMASAGTVYLQDGTQAEGAGTVYVRNGNRSNNFSGWTPFPAGVSGDSAASLKNVSLAISEAGRVSISEDLRIRNLTIAGDEGTDHCAVNLNGNTLKVKTAKLGAAKLAPGTYTAADCPDFLVGDGSLVVTGGAFAILVR